MIRAFIRVEGSKLFSPSSSSQVSLTEGIITVACQVLGSQRLQSLRDLCHSSILREASMPAKL